MGKHIGFTGLWLWVALMAMVVGCSPSAQVDEPAEVASEELQAIDSLMWRQPDSALAQLQRFVVSPEADSLDVFNGHYCQLLISELLYKNYKQQSNRDDLLQAVGYFDSIVMADGYKKDGRKADARGASLQERNVFLDARAHYINGAGFYERNDVVNACAEYLKALEAMEEQFEEKELTGKKAVFMFYAYNRLLELFSAQFMMDPALSCGEQALAICQHEPALSNEIPNTYYHIGRQYDKKEEMVIAARYYELAKEGMSNTDNPIYRDVIYMKALCDYQLGLGAEQTLNTMKQTLANVQDERECATRFLLIGSVFSEEGVYDSALRYFELAFKNETDATSKIRAAESIRIVYDSLGDREKANEFMRYVTDHKESEGENKALVSKLEDMFKDHINQKQKKEAEEAREKAVRKAMNIIIPVAIGAVLIIIVVAKLRSKKLLKEQQEKADRVLGEAEQEHDKELRLWQAEADKTLEETKKRHESEMEAERLTYQKEQEALWQSLRQHEARVNALETALVQQCEEAERRREAFLKEPICQRILGQVRRKPITTRENAFELGLALKDEDFEQLRAAVEKHYSGFDYALLSRYPDLKYGHLALCHLHLLGINESEIAVLKNVSYSAIKKQNESLQEKLELKEGVAGYVLSVAESLCVTQDVTQTKETIEEDLDAWIVCQIKENPKITTEELAKKSQKCVRTIKRHIAIMEHIRYVGSGYSGHWEVVE